MIDSTSHDNGNLAVPSSAGYGVILPCDPEQFAEFISGLLGKPQTIVKSITGVFELRKQDLINIFHLVDQRIRQQNDASLVQSAVRILYNDDSSVLLNSLVDFEHYNEIRPIASIGVVISWTYLIKFNNKRVPEKQEITLSFRSNENEYGENVVEDDFSDQRPSRSRGPARIIMRINHTERTWGVDIESLITGHVKTLFKSPTKTEKFIHKHSGSIGFLVGVLFFLSAIAGVFLTSNKFIESYLEKVHVLANEAESSAIILSSKLDFLIDIISTGAWPRFIFSVVVFLVISLILAIFLGAWVGSKADNRPASYVLLSKSAEEKRVAHMSKLRRDWFMFGISIATSVLAGIASNIIFSNYFGGIG